ncbi:MAG: hypothetical protein IKC77_04835 [Lentisphaeria bacterium]|nr:hypothetical protein [Lentisphaeria bacterium]
MENSTPNNISDRLIERLNIFWRVIAELENMQPEEIDLLPLMKAVPNLRFPTGTELRFFMYGDHYCAEPVFIVRNSWEQNLPDDFKIDPENLMRDVLKALDSVKQYFNEYFVWELILFAELGNQFNLVWHAGYKTQRIICNMEEFLSGYYCGQLDDCYFYPDQLDEKRKSRLLSWDVVPKIQIHPEYAVAEYCIFSPFSGFFKVQRKIQFVPQITISEPRIIQRVLYNSQIVF